MGNTIDTLMLFVVGSDGDWLFFVLVHFSLIWFLASVGCFVTSILDTRYSNMKATHQEANSQRPKLRRYISQIVFLLNIF